MKYISQVWLEWIMSFEQQILSIFQDAYVWISFAILYYPNFCAGLTQKREVRQMHVLFHNEASIPINTVLPLLVTGHKFCSRSARPQDKDLSGFLSELVLACLDFCFSLVAVMITVLQHSLLILASFSTVVWCKAYHHSNFDTFQ